MRYRLRTLMIVLALGPPFIWWFGPGLLEDILDAHWRLTTPVGMQTSTTVGGEIFSNGKSYGRLKDGDVISMKSRGRVYVNGKLRQPDEPQE